MKRIIIDPKKFFDIEPIYIDSLDIDFHNNYTCTKFAHDAHKNSAVFFFEMSDFAIENSSPLPKTLKLQFNNSHISQIKYESNIDAPFMIVDIFQRCRFMHENELHEIFDGKKGYILDFMTGIRIEIISSEVFIEYE